MSIKRFHRPFCQTFHDSEAVADFGHNDIKKLYEDVTSIFKRANHDLYQRNTSDLVEKNGFSLQELFFIRLYTGVGYRLINGALMGDEIELEWYQIDTELEDAYMHELSEIFPKISQAMKYTLNKLPKINENTLFYRKCHMDEGYFNDILDRAGRAEYIIACVGRWIATSLFSKNFITYI